LRRQRTIKALAGGEPRREQFGVDAKTSGIVVDKRTGLRAMRENGGAFGGDFG
jgi:hypothetical protein